jgi:micrococcal nuclease
MRSRAPSAVALLLALLLIAYTSSCAFADEFRGKVVSVSDGDTVTVLHDGLPERIRLSGIDAPESKQAFGTKAKQFTAKKCFGKDVLVKCSGRDRYGRTIAEVLLPDGNSVNQLLLKEGYAWVYRKYTKDPELYLLEASARKEQNGLWSAPYPIAPWDFRRGVTDTAMNKTAPLKLHKSKAKRPKEPVG